MSEVLALSFIVIVLTVPVLLFLRDIRITLEKILKKLEAEG